MEEAFIKAILADPADDTPRLVYADWLEENGEPERGEFIRVQCMLAALPEPEEKTIPGYNSPALERQAALRRRARELLEEHWAYWTGLNLIVVCVNPSSGRPPPGSVAITFRRGFVEAVTLPTALFLEHAPALFSSQPVTRVALADRGTSTSRFDPQRFCLLHPDVPDAPPAATLPEELFALLKGGRRSVPRCRWYDSVGEAAEDVSLACCLFGRRAAGLPPLPPG